MNDERYSNAVDEGPDADRALVAAVGRVDELRRAATHDLA